MAKTTQQIAERALQELRVTEAGQAPNAEDIATIDVMAGAEFLAALDVVDLTSQVAADAVEDAWFLAFSRFVAAEHAGLFSVPTAPAGAMRAQAIMDLERMADRARPVVEMSSGLGWMNRRRY